MTDTPNPLGPPPWSQWTESRLATDVNQRTFVVTWANGRTELVESRYFSVPSNDKPYWTFVGAPGSPNLVVLAAHAPQIDMVRDITDGETFGGVL